MSVAIDNVNIGSIDDKRICLNNSTIARVMSIGTTWQKLRICCRLAIDDSGANITGTPLLYIGVLASPSASVANGPLGTTTSHFVGARTAVATWTRIATPIVYYTIGNAWQAVKRVGNVSTTSAFTSTLNVPTVASNCRWPLLVEITKGNPNYTIQVMFPNGTVTSIDITKVSFDGFLDPDDITQCESYMDGAQGFNANRMLTPASTTVAVNEGTDGALNALCFAWDKTTVMRISDVRFRRLA